MLTGVQLAKMTPFRSYCVTTVSSLTSTIVFGMGLYGGMTSYINVGLACNQLGWTCINNAQSAYAFAAEWNTCLLGDAARINSSSFVGDSKQFARLCR